MNKILIAFFCGIGFLLSLPTYSQKNIDIDNLAIKVTYKDFPLEPQEPLFFCYNTNIIAGDILKNRVSMDGIEKTLIIAGQQKTIDTSKAKLTLEVRFGDFKIEANIKTRNEKNLKGETSVSYALDITYEMSRYYRILDAQGVVLKNEDKNRITMGYNSSDYKKFSTYSEADNYWKSNQESLSAKYSRDLVTDFINRLTKYATNQYGFVNRTVNDKLMITDEEKHPENEMFQKMTNSLKKELEKMTPTQGLENEKIKDIIEYYKGIPQKYADPKLKADKKLRYAAYYNLCKIYLYSDEPQKVEEYADLLIANDYDKKDGEKLKENATDLEQRLMRTTIHKSHFNETDYLKN